MKKPTIKEAEALIHKAAEEGRVAFAVPEAEECFPLKDSIDTDRDFHYIKATVLAPFRTTEVNKLKYVHDGGLHFQWGIKGLGFGEASIVLQKGKWVADTETLGRKFMQKLLIAWTKKMQIR